MTKIRSQYMPLQGTSRQYTRFISSSYSNFIHLGKIECLPVISKRGYNMLSLHRIIDANIDCISSSWSSLYRSIGCCASNKFSLHCCVDYVSYQLVGVVHWLN